MTSVRGARVAVVTGAARGIGLGIAQRFAAHGDRVVLTDADGAAGTEAARELAATGAQAHFIEFDVRERTAASDVVREVEASIGEIDIWVNNAGIVRRGPAESLAADDWTDSLEVILSGAFYASQAVGQRMLERGAGVIVNNASVNGYHPIEGRVAYSVAKAGLIMLTQALGIEWASRGVRVVGVAPGVIGTAMVRQAISDGAASAETYERRTPMHRLGGVDEVAEAVLFLASDEASYITGETLPVDGGWTAYQLF